MAAVSDSRPLWRTMSPEQLEREYSPSSAIGGDYAPFIRDYRAGSDSARAACTRVETLAYGDRPSNSIDIALPDNGEACPLLVYIHGGYWQELSKIESFCGADRFCERGIAYAAWTTRLRRTSACPKSFRSAALRSKPCSTGPARWGSIRNGSSLRAVRPARISPPCAAARRPEFPKEPASALPARFSCQASMNWSRLCKRASTRPSA